MQIEAELHGPPLPPAVSYVWDWFLDLHAARGAGGMTMAAITYPDIDAWSRLAAVRPTPWEVGLLTELDRLLRAETSKSRPKAGEKPGQGRR